MAYDKAAVQMKGLAAITNFDLSLYLEHLDPGGCSSAGLGGSEPAGCMSHAPNASSVGKGQDLLARLARIARLADQVSNSTSPEGSMLVVAPASDR